MPNVKPNLITYLAVFIFSCTGLAQNKLDTINNFNNEVVKICPVCKNDKKAISEVNYSDFHTSHILFSKGLLDSSFVYVSKIITLNKIKSKEFLYVLHSIKGRILTEKLLYDDAIINLNKAIEYGRSSNSIYVSNLYAILSKIYIEEKQYSKAIVLLEEWKSSTNNKIDNKSVNFHNLGISYLHIENFKKAEENLLISYKLNQKSKDTLGLARSSLDLANLYYVQYKDNLAISYFEKGLTYAKKANDLTVLQNALFNLSVVEENRKNFSKSLEYRKGYELIKDSIWNRDQVWKLAQKDKKITVAIKEKQIKNLELTAQLQKEKLKTAQLKKNVFIIIAILFLILVIISGYYNLKITKQNRVIIEQKEDLKELVKTKDKLFSIIAHDLKSPINLLKKKLFNVLEKIKIVEPYNAANFKLVVDSYQLSKRTFLLLDNTLHWVIGNQNKLIFNEEKLHLKSVISHVNYDYIYILEDKGIEFISEVNDTIFVNADLNSLKIILRNVLDNAIKFSYPKSNIIMTSEINDNQCVIKLKDAGIGFDFSNEAGNVTNEIKSSRDLEGNMGTGLGLQLCKVLTEKNGGKFQIVSAVNKGTEVFITLNLNKA